MVRSSRRSSVLSMKTCGAAGPHQTRTRALWCMCLAPLRCEASDAPGSWAPAMPRCPNRCKIPHPHTRQRSARNTVAAKPTTGQGACGVLAPRCRAGEQPWPRRTAGASLSSWPAGHRSCSPRGLPGGVPCSVTVGRGGHRRRLALLSGPLAGAPARPSCQGAAPSRAAPLATQASGSAGQMANQSSRRLRCPPRPTVTEQGSPLGNSSEREPWPAVQEGQSSACGAPRPATQSSAEQPLLQASGQQGRLQERDAHAPPPLTRTLSSGVMDLSAVLLVRSSAPRMTAISCSVSVPPNPALLLCTSTSALSCARRNSACGSSRAQAARAPGGGGGTQTCAERNAGADAPQPKLRESRCRCRGVGGESAACLGRSPSAQSRAESRAACRWARPAASRRP